MNIVPLEEIADVNPRLTAQPAAADPIAFVPMARLDAVTAQTGLGETRAFEEVAKGYTLFHDRDLLVAKITPCFENNKIGQAHLRHPVGAGSTEFHVVRPKPDKVDVRYLLHFLRQDRVRAEGERRMTGSGGQRRVPTDFLKKLNVPLPSLIEQRRIAAILDQVDYLRSKRHQALAYLDDVLRSAFLDVVRDKDVVLRKLGELADLFAGSNLPAGEVFAGQRDGYLLMKVSDMNCPGNEREIVSCALWSKETGALSATCPAGSIIIPKRGGAIKTNKKRLSKRPTVLDPNLMAIAPGPELDLQYLFAWFIQFDLSSITSGSSVPQLNKQDLSPLVLPFPPLNRQRDFAKTARHVAGLAAMHFTQIKTLDDLSAGLQTQKFVPIL